MSRSTLTTSHSNGQPDEIQYVGVDSGPVIITKEPYDKWGWKRYQAAKKLGVPESELPDEPDDDASSAFEAYA